MVEDSILVALIRESVEASTRHRRLAALVILDVLRKGGMAHGQKLELIEADAVGAVADEIKGLVRDYHLKEL